MKKSILLFSLFVLQFTFSFAQITITRSDFGVIGDKTYSARDTTVSSTVSPGTTGVNQVWNFKTVMSADKYDSAMFTDPSSDPKAPVGSNMRIIEGIDTQYLIINTNFARILMPAPSPFQGLVNLKVMQFPSNYLTQFTDSSTFAAKGTPADFGQSNPLIDSMIVVVKLYMNIICDGWGTIITPIDSVSALRFKNTSVPFITVSGKIHLTGQWTVLNSGPQAANISYNWAANGMKNYIAEITMDSLGTAIKEFKYRVLTVPNLHAGINNISNSDVIFSVYPNPANDVLNISFAAQSSPVNVRLFDTSGRVVKQSNISNNQTTIGVSDLNNGIYFITLKGNDFYTTKKIVINK